MREYDVREYDVRDYDAEATHKDYLIGDISHIGATRLALLWQIYSGRRSLQIHFRQCGHRCGGSRAKSSRMAWRTAGKVG
jgi:hypothetical protein